MSFQPTDQPSRLYIFYCDTCDQELKGVYYLGLHTEGEGETHYCEACLKKELNESNMRRRD
jgi:hypothetical protein